MLGELLEHFEFMPGLTWKKEALPKTTRLELSALRAPRSQSQAVAGFQFECVPEPEVKRDLHMWHHNVTRTVSTSLVCDDDHLLKPNPMQHLPCLFMWSGRAKEVCLFRNAV